MLLDPDYHTPSMGEATRDSAIAAPVAAAPSPVSQADSEATRDDEPDVHPVVVATTEDAAKAAWLAKQWGSPTG